MSRPRVLFLCTGNSCRSQMAEGWLRHLAGDRLEAHSAGVRPTAVNPYAIAVMREVGIDLTEQQSKNVSAYLGQHFAWIITVCDNARESCPIFPGMSLREHWPLEDPADATGSEEEILAVFRKTRDEVEAHVQDFLTRATTR